VILKTNREDFGGKSRLVIVSGNANLPEGGEMPEAEDRARVVRLEKDEDGDEVEAHKRSQMENVEPKDDTDSSDDFEAHKRSQMESVEPRDETDSSDDFEAHRKS
jgi:hypothetical protein